MKQPGESIVDRLVEEGAVFVLDDAPSVPPKRRMIRTRMHSSLFLLCPLFPNVFGLRVLRVRGAVSSGIEVTREALEEAEAALVRPAP